VFLPMVIVANKFICSWGCQLGTLQDAIFRLNRDKQDRKGLIRQFKVPFVISNSVRVAFFTAIVAFAFFWATDIVEGIDPFKTFQPQALGWAGAAFVGAMLVLSLFTWRPWCHFLCPFGLVGWATEKISWFKVHVDYDKCIACGACAKACPSTVMGAILKRDRMYLSSANETVPGTYLSSCITSTCVARPRGWPSAPSNAILPGELASCAPLCEALEEVAWQRILMSSTRPSPCSFEPLCSRRGSRDGCVGEA
jgi:polyferredoxin